MKNDDYYRCCNTSQRDIEGLRPDSTSVKTTRFSKPHGQKDHFVEKGLRLNLTADILIKIQEFEGWNETQDHYHTKSTNI